MSHVEFESATMLLVSSSSDDSIARRAVRGKTQEQLDHVQDAQSNSIGALLAKRSTFSKMS